MSLNENITKTEIQSLTKSFLLKNNFEVPTQGIHKETLNYRLEASCPPKFKIPDHVAVKGNLVIVFEDKAAFSDLFTGKCSDVKKLSSFLASQHALEAFEKMLSVNQEKHCIIGGCASLWAPSNSKRTLPTQFVSLSISRKKDNYFTVTLAQDAGHGEAFAFPSADFELP